MLTSKQEKFCINFIKCSTAGEAAIVAGYSKKYAAQNCDKLLKLTKIQERIAELRKRTEDKSVMSLLERKQRLTEIARPLLTDFMELGADGSWVNIGKETPGGAAIQEIHSRTEYDKDGNVPTIYTSVKLHDPMKAIDLLNKMDGVYDDSTKVNIDQRTQSIVYNVIHPDTPKLLERLENGEREPNMDADKSIPREHTGLPSGQAPNP
jgi:phage terminase small subunit